MSTRKSQGHRERHIRVRAIRKDPPDLKKLGRALIALVQAKAEAEAQAEHERKQPDQKNCDNNAGDAG